jgi:hypothetical protein
MADGSRRKQSANLHGWRDRGARHDVECRRVDFFVGAAGTALAIAAGVSSGGGVPSGIVGASQIGDAHLGGAGGDKIPRAPRPRFETSMMRPRANGPRSLTRTTTTARCPDWSRAH